MQSNTCEIKKPHQQQNYFRLRNNSLNIEYGINIPTYLKSVLPINKDASFLDIGCGYGEFLGLLRNNNYVNLLGVDINKPAIGFCLKNKLNCMHINNINDFIHNNKDRQFDFITMNHVLEHINKEEIIKTLTIIREKLLSPTGKIFLKVPNAQSNTGCYWAYEDFTHETLFTTGSVYYVLKAAGFNSIQFIDPYDLDNLSFFRKFRRKILLKLYEKNKSFWNNITRSYYHAPSPVIYSYELKIVATNQ